MAHLPFAIPKSLASYVVQYQDSPDKTIRRLHKQLKKRGPDPIGYFLLAWFYHEKGLREEAISYALTAKNFAPGSPFMTSLHYFFSHPQLFDAWQNPSSRSATGKSSSASASGPIPDLDRLIQKLSAIKSPRIQSGKPPPEGSGSSLSDGSDDVDDIVSETLAKIHERQGKTEAAIKIYQRLLTLHKDNNEQYKKEIARLQEKKKTERRGS